MARIRSVHPSIWTDEVFVALSPAARLLFIGLLNESDDHGIFEWKPLTLKMRLLPADLVDTNALLEELLEADRVRLFSDSGRKYGCVRNFCKWQRPKKPVAVHPINDDVRRFVGLLSDDEDRGSSLRKAKWADQSGCCFYCQAAITYYSKRSDSLEIDHRIPRCQGGTDDDENLVATCRACNRAKNGLSEAEFRAKRTFAVPKVALAPPNDPRKIQREEIGGREEEEGKEEPASQGAAAPEPKAVQPSFLPPEPKPEPNAMDLLFWKGLPVLAHLAGKSPDDVRGGLAKLALIAGPEIVLETILDCEKAPPKGSLFAWIKRVAEAEAKRRKGPVLIVNNAPADPDDLYGIQAWCASLPGVKPAEEADRVRGKWDYAGRIVDATARQVAFTARFPDAWRGNWDMLREWLDAGIPTATILQSVERCIAKWEGYDPKRIGSLAAFDAWVRPGRAVA